MLLVPELSGKRILVTGASGFLGSHLCRRFADTNADVFAVSRTQPTGVGERVRWLRVDLSESTAVRSLVAQTAPEIVFQLSGHANASRDRELIYPTLTSDLITTVHLLMAVAEHPVRRFVMTASLEEPEPGDAPTSPYAAAKVGSTAYGRMFQVSYGVPVVLVRPFMTYGPRQPERKIIPYLIRTLLKNEVPKLGNGDRLVDWIYVDDVIDGCLAAALADGVEGMTFDLGSGNSASIRDVAQLAASVLGSSTEPEFGHAARTHERVRVANLDPARTKLGWQPKTLLRDGLRYTADFYRERPAQGV